MSNKYIMGKGVACPTLYLPTNQSIQPVGYRS